MAKKLNTVSVEKLRDIYSTFFDPDSETVIDEEVLEHLHFTDVISRYETVLFRETLKRIGERAYIILQKEDKRVFNETYKKL